MFSYIAFADILFIILNNPLDIPSIKVCGSAVISLSNIDVFNDKLT